ncbi:MAG: 4-hydroxybenzoate octaprenyltransferase [Planctomycetota bacterium]
MTSESTLTQPPGPWRAVAGVLGDIKLAHTVFAMPFAVLAVFLARDPDAGLIWTGVQLVLVVACMFFARTWAMLVNRIVDARIDVANPRTAGRAVASGRVSEREAWAVAVGCAGLFLAVCALFWALLDNPWPLAFGIPVLAWIAFYSITKRFTRWCHLFLGGALAASPIAAAIAVRPEALLDTEAIWWLAGMVMLWVAGFDVLYALQDEVFDRDRGLHSIPAAHGARGAVWMSRAMHLGAVFSLAMAWRVDPRLGVFFGGAVIFAAALLVLEHVVVSRQGLRGLPLAFFTLNGVISVLLGVVGSAETLY